MKMLITTLLVSLGISSTTASAHDTQSVKNETRNMALVTQLYKEVYEKKEFDQLNKYLASDVEFYKNFANPLNFSELKNHLIEQGKECVKINLLPFDNILAAGNKVVTTYTRSCTDEANNTHKRRIMAITEINSQHKVSKITIVTHEEKESA
jgi:hypothetical protein